MWADWNLRLRNRNLPNMRVYWWKPNLELSVYRGFLNAFPQIPSYRILKGNYGDSLNQEILDWLLIDYPKYIWADELSCNFTGIGSVLNRLLEKPRSNHITVWGSGLRTEPINYLSQKDLKNLEFIAVRGKLTAQSLKCGSGIPLGDPGLLVSKTLNENIHIEIPILFVPHFSFLFRKNSKYIIELLKSNGIQIAYPYERPSEITAKIARTDLLISSALHALVTADSFGIAAVRLIDLNDQESDFKYLDYLSGIDDLKGWPEVELSDFVRKIRKLKSISEKARVRTSHVSSSVEKVKFDLIDSFENWNKGP